MYRYHLIASFDRHVDRIISIVHEGTSTIDVKIPMLSESGYLLYGLQRTVEELKKQNNFPSETGFDAILLGLLVYMADMKISRRIQAQDSWSREICLSVPVFDERWFRYQRTLERLLKFLTGDLWSIEFSRRDVRLASEDSFEKRTDRYRLASLFSGGMDSLIGVINNMEQKEPTLLVSHAGESRVRH